MKLLELESKDHCYSIETGNEKHYGKLLNSISSGGMRQNTSSGFKQQEHEQSILKALPWPQCHAPACQDSHVAKQPAKLYGLNILFTPVHYSCVFLVPSGWKSHRHRLNT